jgi:two-component system OmpR family response regulator
MNILLIEDEVRIAAFIKKTLLDLEGVSHVSIGSNFNDGFQKIFSNAYDLAIIDINLSDKEFNGLHLCKMIRKKSPDIPILVITAYHSMHYLKEAFELDVNDYIKKPFDPKEIQIRVKRWFGKTQRLPKKKISYDSLSYDSEKNSFYFKRKAIKISKINKKLLTIFIKNPEKILSQEFLKEKLWADYHLRQNRNIRSNIQLLRKDLKGACSNWIQNRPGEGYILTNKENRIL